MAPDGVISLTLTVGIAAPRRPARPGSARRDRPTRRGRAARGRGVPHTPAPREQSRPRATVRLATWPTTATVWPG